MIFDGTAHAYAIYRPRYPQHLITHLVNLSPAHRHAADLGTGTGELARPLSHHFDHITATDINPDMISCGQHQAATTGIDNITWQVAAAEATTLPPRSVDLVTIGSAFHWMRQEHVLGRVADWLVPGGVCCLVTGNSPWRGT